MEDLLEAADQDMYGTLPDLGLPTIREEEEEDGSRSTNGAACAFPINDEIFSFQLNSRCSAYTSELMAIFLCLQKISELQNEKDFVIMTDSLSSLHAMTSFFDNPIIQRNF